MYIYIYMYLSIYIIYPQVLNGTKLALPRFPNGPMDPNWLIYPIRRPSWPTAGPCSTTLNGLALGKLIGNCLWLWRMVSRGILWYLSDYSWKESVDGNKILRGAHQQKWAKDATKKRFTNMRQHANSGTCQSWGSIQCSTIMAYLNHELHYRSSSISLSTDGPKHKSISIIMA